MPIKPCRITSDDATHVVFPSNVGLVIRGRLVQSQQNYTSVTQTMICQSIGISMYGDRFWFYIKSRIRCLGGGTPPCGGSGGGFWLDPGYPPPVLVSFRVLRGGSSLWFRKIGDFSFHASKRLGPMPLNAPPEVLVVLAGPGGVNPPQCSWCWPGWGG